MRGDTRELRKGCQLQAARVIPSHDHGETVVETKRRLDIQTELAQILLLHLSIHTLGIAGRMFFQDGGERGSGVLDVHIDASGEQGLMTDVGSGKIEAPLDRLATNALQELRQHFAKDQLFGEVLGADGERPLARHATSGGNERKAGQEAATVHVSGSCGPSAFRSRSGAGPQPMPSKPRGWHRQESLRYPPWRCRER